jgi:hypothetical protein
VQPQVSYFRPVLQIARGHGILKRPYLQIAASLEVPLLFRLGFQPAQTAAWCCPP